MFRTQAGRSGLGPPCVRPGDVICEFDSAAPLFVLRYLRDCSELREDASGGGGMSADAVNMILAQAPRTENLESPSSGTRDETLPSQYHHPSPDNTEYSHINAPKYTHPFTQSRHTSRGHIHIGPYEGRSTEQPRP